MNDNLTRREIEILQLVNLGMSDNKIAQKLFVSYETIRTHGKHIRRKIGSQWPRRTVLSAAASEGKEDK
jgi:DNA-binding CsgD family transcriptional regulator